MSCRRVLRVAVGHLTVVAVAAGLSSAMAQPSFPAIGDRAAAYVASTPGFLVNGELLYGALPLKAFEELIDEILRDAGQ